METFASLCKGQRRVDAVRMNALAHSRDEELEKCPHGLEADQNYVFVGESAIKTQIFRSAFPIRTSSVVYLAVEPAYTLEKV